MRYLSVCSGIEAATQAWHPLGWQPVAFSEIEPFPCAVLAHHYPHVPNWGDMTRYQEWPDADVDVLCGGTPCQDYSVAGRRLGMAGARGQLSLTFIEIGARYRPRWILWENVPGVLSSNGGRDFARFLGDLAGRTIHVPAGGWQNSGIIPGIGDAYGLAFRVLDAQHVRTRRFPNAVPQRRRRVFVVGYLGDWRRAAAVLFDRESLSGHPAPRREAGQSAAGRTAKSLAVRGRDGTPQIELGDEVANAILTPNGGRAGIGVGAALIQSNSGDVGYCLTASAQQSLAAETETLLAVAHTLKAEGFDASEDGTGRQNLAPLAFDCKGTEVQTEVDGIHSTLRGVGHGGGHAAVAFAENSRSELRLCGGDCQVMSQLTTGGGKPGQGQPTVFMPEAPWAVRRLTPAECERLQGFPDGFTNIPWRKKPDAPDGPRYKALGNSWAVNCAEWIGERIAEVDAWAA